MFDGKLDGPCTCPCWFGLLVDAFFPAQQKHNRNEDLKFGEPAVKSVKGLLLIQDPSCEYPL